VIKSISLLTRKDGWTLQSHILEERGRPDAPTLDVDIDGIAELWYDSRESMAAAVATPAATALYADGALFIGRIKTYTVEEQQIIPTTP
jgi:hypothetical protein